MVSVHNCAASAIDANGKILIGGEVNDNFPDNFVLVRYTSGVTGVSDLANENIFSVYPNPATDLFQIDYSNLKVNDEIRIVDLTGRVMKSKTSTGIADEMKFATENFGNGIYFVQILSGGNFISQKIIVQH